MKKRFIKYVFSVTRRSRSDVAESVSQSALTDLTDVTLVSEDAAHNSLQMSSSRDLTDVSEDAAHNYLQMLSSGDLTDETLSISPSFPVCFPSIF